MKSFFRFLIVIYFIFRIFECSDNERKKAEHTEREARYKSREVTNDIRVIGENRSSQVDTATGFIKEGAKSIFKSDAAWEREDDSLRRLYDKNSPDYHYEREYFEYNEDDDDEWHGYYND